jgi:CRISPR-associated protein Csm2
MASNPQNGPGGRQRSPGKPPGRGPRPAGGGPRDGGPRDGAPRDGAPRGGPPRDTAPRDGARREGGGPPRPDLPALPRANPPRYFTDEARAAIRRDLLEDRADALARACAAVPASLMRRFYDEVGLIERRVPPDGDPDPAAIQAQMVLMKARAAHAFRRRGKAENFPHELLQFFVDHAAAVQDARDLGAFRRIFEAVVAYHRFYERTA